MEGYQTTFLGKKFLVPLPAMDERLRNDIAPVTDSPEGILRYTHHSLYLSKSRLFPILTATNIDGKLFKNIKRTDVFDSGTDEWRIDPRAKQYQYGPELYEASKSDFHRGHMTKREDPQWGITLATARAAAQSTFFYSNSVPQVEELNVREWGGLERYILNSESVKRRLKINVFTGPVLSTDDPVFVSIVKGKRVQLPTLFWKVVYFVAGGILNRVGFLMAQHHLLVTKGIVRPTRGLVRGKTPFSDFVDAATYQVNIATIEHLSGLTFAAATEPFKDTRPVKLVMKEVEVPRAITRGMPAEETVGYIYENIAL